MIKTVSGFPFPLHCAAPVLKKRKQWHILFHPLPGVTAPSWRIIVHFHLPSFFCRFFIVQSPPALAGAPVPRSPVSLLNIFPIYSVSLLFEHSQFLDRRCCSGYTQKQRKCFEVFPHKKIKIKSNQHKCASCDFVSVFLCEHCGCQYLLTAALLSLRVTAAFNRITASTRDRCNQRCG